LLDGLMEICSKEESAEAILTYFSDKITHLKNLE